MSATLDILADFAAPAPAPVRIGWSTNQTEWAFDVPAIERAARNLGITQPITIGATRGRGGRAKSGLHHTDANGHRIHVLGLLGRAEATATVWHELMHAQQAERYPTFADFDAAYRSNPARFERESEACEHQHEHEPLVR